MNNEHDIKIELKDLPFYHDGYRHNGYRCSCGEGITATSLRQAKQIHDDRLNEIAKEQEEIDKRIHCPECGYDQFFWRLTDNAKVCAECGYMPNYKEFNK